MVTGSANTRTVCSSWLLTPTPRRRCSIRVRRYLAWQSIVEEVDALNLDKHSEKEAKKNCEDAGKRVEASIRETYRYLLAPCKIPTRQRPRHPQFGKMSPSLCLVRLTSERLILSPRNVSGSSACGHPPI